MDVKFLINTMTAWDEPPRARHQVTSALAKKYGVAFVAANKIGTPRIEYIRENNVLLIQPYYPVNTKIRYRIPLINELYQRWLFYKLKNKFNQVDVINFDFTAYLIHQFFSKVYFYCNDNFTSISKKINHYLVYKYHVYCEHKLASKAQLCVATSSVILEHVKQINSNTHELLLGGPNIDEFNVVPTSEKLEKEVINVGLVGFIRNYNLSYQLINSILEKLSCTVTLIGPVEDDFLRNLKYRDRIILKGVLTGERLIEEVNKFDVAIAPYIDSKIDEGAFPNKLLVYLALGKPIVVTDLLSLRNVKLPSKMIYTARNNDEFPDKIITAHNENNAHLIKRRIAYSKENTWDIRMEKFLELTKKKNNKLKPVE